MALRRISVLLSVVCVLGGLASTPSAGAVSPSRAAHPAVSGISVRRGPTRGGTRIVIRGAHFTNVRAVYFGRARATPLHVRSPRAFIVRAPRHVAGVVHVVVRTAAGRSRARRTDRFTYVAPPRITGVSPNTDISSDWARVTVRGDGFSSDSQVRFGDVPGTAVRVLNPHELQVTAPPHDPKAVHLRVTNRFGTSPVSALDTFTYGAAPTVSRLDPASGDGAQPSPVTVRGTGFTPDSAVYIGDVAAAGVEFVSPDELQATVPAHVGEIVHVQVTTAFGTSEETSGDQYTFTGPPAPVGCLEAADVTADSVTLRWPSATQDQVSGYRITRNGWSSPVILGPDADSYSDSALDASSSYDYAVIAFTDFAGTEVDSAPTSVTVTTPSATGPGIPTGIRTGTATTDTAADSCAATAGWVGPSIGSTRLAAYLTDPSPGTPVWADFHVVDLGADGTGSPTPVADAVSDTTTGTGQVYSDLDSDEFVAGHEYEVTAVGDDGVATSPPGAPLYFHLGNAAPDAPTITSTDFLRDGSGLCAGQTGVFHVSVDGAAGTIDHFDYATDYASSLNVGGGTRVDPDPGTARATIQLTPTTLGTNYLYVDAIGRSSAPSFTSTYEYFVHSC